MKNALRTCLFFLGILFLMLSMFMKGWAEENRCEKNGFKHYWIKCEIPVHSIFEICKNCGAIRRKYTTYRILYSPTKDYWGNDKYWDGLPFKEEQE